MLGLYPKKALFFGILFVIFGSILIIQSQSQIVADQPISEVSGNAFVTKQITINSNGSVTENGQKIDQVRLIDGRDEFRKEILSQPGEYINNYTVDLVLPSGVAGQSEAKFLAIHGVADSTVTVIDDFTVEFSASDVGPGAELSIVLKMPAGTIRYPFFIQAKNFFSNLSFSIWLLLSIILPLFSVIILFYLIFKELRHSIEPPKEMISSPPMALPPALVGVIVKQKIGPREIAATLIDLAIRGDIVIIDRERGFAFGKNRLEQSLIGYEKVLLGKIFRNNISATRKEIDQRINNYLYSRKISAFYYLIHVLSARMGYLKPNYRQIKMRFSLLAIILFLIGVAGFLLKIFSISSDPPFALFFWISMIISSVIIFALADYIPSITDAGRAEASNWLAFKKFLSDPTEMPFDEKNYDLFARYLPYAVILECEAAWARRFSRHNFAIPNWFITDKPAVGLEDFCLLLFPIVSYVGRNLDTLRQPGI